MNVRSKTTWALALAAVTISLTSACGSDIDPPAQDINNVNQSDNPGSEQGTSRPAGGSGRGHDFGPNDGL